LRARTDHKHPAGAVGDRSGGMLEAESMIDPARSIPDRPDLAS
jgi:hypothetical protein